MSSRANNTDLEIVSDTGTAVVPATGEVIGLSGYGEIAVSVPTAARARAKADLLKIDIRERIEQITSGDEELAALRLELARAEAVVESVQGLISSAIPDEVRLAAGVGMKVKIGDSTITWAKPSERVTSDISLGTVLDRANAGDEDCQKIVKFLGIRVVSSTPSAPSIKWGVGAR